MVLLKTLVFTDTTKNQNQKQNYMSPIVDKERRTNISKTNKVYKHQQGVQIYRHQQNIQVH